MILPLGDEPNPRGVPVVTYALILVNCAAYLFVTLPLSFMQPDPGDPLVREYIIMVFESMSRPVSERGAQAIFNGLNEYALFVFQWGFRPAAPQVQDLFTATVAIVELPETWAPGAILKARTLARLAPPMLADNFEGMAVTREQGRPILWIISDDNHEFFQRTLLLKFALPAM